MRHAEDDDLDLYVLGKLPETQTRSLEQHLLLCEVCQQRLEQTDAFINELRAYAAWQEAESGKTTGAKARLPKTS
jgi:anti-sigma factor RsiW